MAAAADLLICISLIEDTRLRLTDCNVHSAELPRRETRPQKILEQARAGLHPWEFTAVDLLFVQLYGKS